MSPTTQENDFSGTLEQKVDRLVHYATRHSMILTNQQETVIDVQKRLALLEDAEAKRLVREARLEEQNKALVDKIGDLKGAVDGMKGVVTKAAWIIIGAVLLALVRFMLAGGIAGVSA